MMKRRALMQSAIVSGGVLASPLAGAATGERPVHGIIDSNVSLFRWPFRRLPLDETEVLVEKMRSLGVSRMFAGSFEGILHRDLSEVNRRLAGECWKFEELIPVGTINPASPGWQDDLEECADKHGMPGIRLHPNYHEYSLGDARFRKLVRLADGAGMFVQIVAVFEDPRTQPELFRAADVDLAPLADHAGGRIQILNWRPRGEVLSRLARSPHIYFDTARIEATDGVSTLLESVSVDRVLFGTHAPFLIPEASLIRVCESFLEEERENAILLSNAAAWIDD